MAFRNQKKIYTATLAMGLLLLLGIGLNLIGIAAARYQKEPIVSMVYGQSPADLSTLSQEGCIYDFGCWTLGESEDPQATIVLHQEASLKGTLRFSFDDETTQKNDVALLTDWGVSGIGGEYSVEEADGRLDLPFSMVISSQNRSGLVYLDVEWIPDGTEFAAETARYLLTLNPQALCGGVEDAPSFKDATGFLTQDLLSISLETPKSGTGFLLAQGPNLGGTFSAGICYYTPEYPQGITLLQNSVLYLPSDESGAQELLIDFNGQGSVDPIKLTAGGSDGSLATTTQTPAAQTASLELNAKNMPVLNSKQPLVLTVQEPKAIRDSAWNDGAQGGGQLCWELQQLSGGTFSKAEFSEDLTLTVAQTIEGGTLTLAVPTGVQAAGTYQLVIKQTYNGYPINTSTVRFFIDYR